MHPLDEYRARKDKWGAQQAITQRSFIAIGNWRLLIAIGAGGLAWFTFAKSVINPWFLLIPLVVFIALVVWHQRVLKRRKFAERAIRFYQEGINRIQDKWTGAGKQGAAFRDPNHIYADDLDVCGRGGLFELLSSARTHAGERMLADWLLSPATPELVRERQVAVRELAPKLDLREEMALLGEDIQSSVDAGLLTAWGWAPRVAFPAALRLSALVLSLAGLLSLALKLAEVWPLWPLLVILLVNGGVMFVFRKQTAQVEASIEAAAHQLTLLALLVERLEYEKFASPGLTRLRAALSTEGVPASKCIRRLDRWLELLDSSDHIILRALGPLLLYKQQLVMAIEAWRLANGLPVGRWIQALAEFEALSSFGSLHYERPAWCFPFVNEEGRAYFSAKALGHPLLPAAIAVTNDLELNPDCRLLIVSGSNMSGKSTLLRSVGLNTILALAGAPVCASALQLSHLQVGASLRTSDSLQDNRSRFFAEISRLRQIVELTRGPVPVLFLLDELLSGTNSHDRRIGATGVVRGLLAANTIGMLTTHDLALAQLDQETAFAARNVHLEDKIVEGRIEFDYHLRAGVVTHSNALELMRSIGLEI